ncbi:hypothetical protein SELMODRAFT_421828 [Selaginella moellendorffii]|uniref:Uncharacterized protein n=1 Tax=Selaginella moellendorffii TaxID=88036 RepID=D8SGH5_SELML|nr:hypothetical protein SELMODRAFT_421828 [Selaginella moellendorffii]
MTAIENHKRDYPGSGSLYNTPDSGGKCGVPYRTYFRMPVQDRWYSMAISPMHFTVISTEHDWSLTSKQYTWMESNLESVNKFSTPWIVFTGGQLTIADNIDESDMIIATNVSLLWNSFPVWSLLEEGKEGMIALPGNYMVPSSLHVWHRPIVLHRRYKSSKASRLQCLLSFNQNLSGILYLLPIRAGIPAAIFCWYLC